MDGLPEDIAVKYRGAEQGDINFILHSWMKSLRPWRRNIDNENFFRGQQALIAALAETSRIVICCDAAPGMSNFVFGWVCGEMDVPRDILTIHYIYVKNGYRLAGLGRDLLTQMGRKPTTPIVATHWTGVARDCRDRYRVDFNDYPLMIGNQHVHR